MLKRIKKKCYYFKDGKKIIGIHENIRGDVAYRLEGDVTGIEGDVTGIEGDITYIEGDVSSIRGDVTGIYGDVSEAVKEYMSKNNITELEKIDVSLLVENDLCQK